MIKSNDFRIGTSLMSDQRNRLWFFLIHFVPPALLAKCRHRVARNRELVDGRRRDLRFAEDRR